MDRVVSEVVHEDRVGNEGRDTLSFPWKKFSFGPPHEKETSGRVTGTLFRFEDPRGYEKG